MGIRKRPLDLERSFVTNEQRSKNVGLKERKDLAGIAHYWSRFGNKGN